MKVLLDTNVVLDWLRGRQPFADDATRVIAAVEGGRVSAVIAAITISNAYYIARVAPGAAAAVAFVTDLRRIAAVVPFDDSLLARALALSFDDLEDALQAASAEAAGAAFIITRDQSGFAGSPVAPITPAEFVNVLAKG